MKFFQADLKWLNKKLRNYGNSTVVTVIALGHKGRNIGLQYTVINRKRGFHRSYTIYDYRLAEDPVETTKEL